MTDVKPSQSTWSYRRARYRWSAVVLSTVLVVGGAGPALATEADEPTETIKTDAGWVDASALSSYSHEDYTGSMYWIAQEITGAGDYWSGGWTGSGVDVAVIDTGVVEVQGLSYPGKIIYGPDLSFESQSPAHAYLDTFGHGTHMAGIIAGRDNGAEVVEKGDSENFLGMAPGSRIVSVKVGDYQGSADVSQVIAAIDWVVEHKNDNGLNIRVLNISYGTDSTQSHQIDPLANAVERAWKAGIVVVAAAGNDGKHSGLRNPAISPYIIAVGASEGNMTYSTDDDTLATFSSCGTTKRKVDLVAPGMSVVSLRNPGSYADVENPEATVAERFFLGSGTSQAAAVVSGAAALIVDQRPSITPDQVKALLKRTAQKITGTSGRCQGAGLLDLKVARDTPTPASSQYYWSTGAGSLEAARGSIHLERAGVVLEGEQDIFGMPFDSASHAQLAASGTTWSGGDWNGTTWSGTTWSGTTWSGTTWSGA
jgi:serine protease AprX